MYSLQKGVQALETKILSAVSHLRNNTIQELGKFSQNPVGYSLDQLVTFVKDYWDVGVAATSGAAVATVFPEYRPFGDYQGHVIVSGAIVGILAGCIKDSGGIRNHIKGLIDSLKGRQVELEDISTMNRNFFAGNCFLLGYIRLYCKWLAIS